MRQAIGKLPLHLREVVELRHTKQYTYAEIAQKLQVPVGTVKSRLSEATRRLRQAFSEGETEL